MDARSVAWQESDANGRRVHPVGQKQANELGLHDMSGNVKEWVRDCWNAKYDKAPNNGRALGGRRLRSAGRARRFLVFLSEGGAFRLARWELR